MYLQNPLTYNDDFIIYFKIKKKADASDNANDGLTFSIAKKNNFCDGGGGNNGVYRLPDAIVAEFDTYQNNDYWVNSLSMHDCIGSTNCDVTQPENIQYEIELNNVFTKFMIIILFLVWIFISGDELHFSTH